MSYAIVGFGKIGQALAQAFARKNIAVTVASRRAPEVLAPQASRPRWTSERRFTLRERIRRRRYAPGSRRYGFDLAMRVAEPRGTRPALAAKVSREMTRVVKPEGERDLRNWCVVAREEQACPLAPASQQVLGRREPVRSAKQAGEVRRAAAELARERADVERGRQMLVDAAPRARGEW